MTTARRLGHAHYSPGISASSIGLGEPLDGVVEHGQLRLLHDVPHGPAPVDPVVAALVAVLAQGDAQVMQALLDVMRIRWPSSATHTTGHLLDFGQVLAVFGCQVFAVHEI